MSKEAKVNLMFWVITDDFFFLPEEWQSAR